MDNPAAQLARMRAASLTPERRSEIAKIASDAAAEGRRLKISPDKRKEIAAKASAASVAARKAKKATPPE